MPLFRCTNDPNGGTGTCTLSCISTTSPWLALMAAMTRATSEPSTVTSPLSTGSFAEQLPQSTSPWDTSLKRPLWRKRRFFLISRWKFVFFVKCQVDFCLHISIDPSSFISAGLSIAGWRQLQLENAGCATPKCGQKVCLLQYSDSKCQNI